MRKETLTLIRRVRYSPSQWAHVQLRAGECGLTPSTYIRKTSLGAIPKARRGIRNQNVAYHIAKVGNNINQLAHRANAGLPIVQSELSEALQELHRVLREI